MVTTDGDGVLASLLAVLLWAPRQFVAFWRNLWGLVQRSDVWDFLIPAFRSTLRWLIEKVPQAFGLGTREEMLYANIGLAIVSYVSGYITATLTWYLIAVWAILFLVGLLRFIPIVEAYWPGGGA